MTTSSAAISLMRPGAMAPASEKDSDAALVRRFLDDRDPLLFAELIRHHERPVFRLAASLLRMLWYTRVSPGPFLLL